MSFDGLPEFQKDCKKLSKKYRSLDDDLQEFRNVITVVPLGNSKHFNVITQSETFYILKARLFCRYLKGASLRIIYAYWEQEQKIEFIEVYYKGDKENEDFVRIDRYLVENNDV
jgi:hypothetical protein